MTVKRTLSGPGVHAREIDRELIIGRDGADVVIDDPEVSRRHAALRPVVDGIQVEDLGSSNGTFAGGQRIQVVTLTRDTELRIGSTVLQLVIGTPDQPTAARPAPTAPTEATVVRSTIPAAAAAQPVAAAAEDAPAPGKPGGGGPPIKLLAGVGALVVAAVVAVLLISGGGSSQKLANTPNKNCDATFPKMIDDGFPEPPLLFSKNGLLSTKLTATLATVKADGTTNKGFAYNHGSPAPMWVICRGDQLKVDLVNKLPLSTNLHVHGLHVDPDGAADDVFLNLKPLRSHHYTYNIPDDQSPGTFWYHPHWHPFVDPETTGGMFGGIIVEGGLDQRLANIPQRLIMFHGGRIASPTGKPLPIPGVKPGTIKAPPVTGPPVVLVNGAYQPTLKIAPGEIQRWRLWNSTGDRFINMSIPGVTMQLLALDGNTLENMVPRKKLLLGPGERAEVLVQGAPAGQSSVEMAGFQQCFKGCFDPFSAIPANGRVLAAQKLINIDDTGTPVNDTMPTGALAHPQDLRGMPIAVKRTVKMTRVPQNGTAPQYPINDKLFAPARVDAVMKLNSVEEWTLESPDTDKASEWHNFHMHTNPFQVVAINGKPVKSIIWQDTVNVPPNGSVTVLIHPIDFTGTAVFHCHLDFHEDNGMMGVFRIEKNPTAAEVNANKVIYVRPMHMERHAQLAALKTNNDSPFRRAAFLCHLGLAT